MVAGADQLMTQLTLRLMVAGKRPRHGLLVMRSKLFGSKSGTATKNDLVGIRATSAHGLASAEPVKPARRHRPAREHASVGMSSHESS